MCRTKTKRANHLPKNYSPKCRQTERTIIRNSILMCIYVFWPTELQLISFPCSVSCLITICHGSQEENISAGSVSASSAASLKPASRHVFRDPETTNRRPWTATAAAKCVARPGEVCKKTWRSALCTNFGTSDQNLFLGDSSCSNPIQLHALYVCPLGLCFFEESSCTWRFNICACEKVILFACRKITSHESLPVSPSAHP